MGRVFERAQALGVTTSMDTCYDGKDVWLPLIEPSLPHLDLVFSSFEEACGYTGRTTPEDIADFYLSYGVKIAVIKLGGEGVYVKSAAQECRLPAHRVEVVDTTGAGDACRFGWVQGWDLGGTSAGECRRRFDRAAHGRRGSITGMDVVLTFMETLSEAC